ncbi:MAG: transposase, partial [Moorea sp. SIO3B2]|nr:transposase [Moorena sp. SIO3B2]
MGESQRKNLSQIARDSVEVTYHRIHHFLTEAPWEAEQINGRRLELISKGSLKKWTTTVVVLVDYYLDFLWHFSMSRLPKIANPH